jgi:hypothetical protein
LFYRASRRDQQSRVTALALAPAVATAALEAFEPQKAIGQKHQDGVISDDKETASALEPD